MIKLMRTAVNHNHNFFIVSTAFDSGSGCWETMVFPVDFYGKITSLDGLTSARDFSYAEALETHNALSLRFEQKGE